VAARAAAVVASASLPRPLVRAPQPVLVPVLWLLPVQELLREREQL